jgi:hypothetical protein
MGNFSRNGLKVWTFKEGVSSIFIFSFGFKAYFSLVGNIWEIKYF